MSLSLISQATSAVLHLKSQPKNQIHLPHLTSYIKVDAQPRLGNNGCNFGRNLNHQTSYTYKNASGRVVRHEQGGVAQLFLNKVDLIINNICTIFNIWFYTLRSFDGHLPLCLVQNEETALTVIQALKPDIMQDQQLKHFFHVMCSKNYQVGIQRKKFI